MTAAALRHELSEVAITNLALAAMTAISGIALARTLSPSGRGVIALVITWSAIGQQFFSLGIRVATVYFVGGHAYDTRDVVRNASGVALVAGAALVTVGGVCISAGLVPADLQWPLFVVLLASPLALHGGVSSAVAQAEQFTAWSRMRFAQPAVYLVCVVTLGVSGAASALSTAVAYALSLVAQWALNYAVGVARRGYGGVRLAWSHVRLLCGYGVWTTMSAALNVVNTRLDILLLGFVASREELGTYAVAVGISQLVLPVSAVAAPWILPRLAGASGHTRDRRAVRSLQLTLALSCATAIPIAAIAPQLISVLIGDQWLPAVGALRLLLVGSVMLALRNVLVSIANGYGTPQAVAAADSFGAIVTVALLAPLVRTHGIEGAALTSLIAYSVGAAALLRSWRRAAAVRKPRVLQGPTT